MKTATDYLQPHEFKKLTWVKIAAVRCEEVDGRPRIVLYFKGRKKGLVLIREDIDALTAAYGPNPTVEAWLRNGQAEQ